MVRRVRKNKEEALEEKRKKLSEYYQSGKTFNGKYIIDATPWNETKTKWVVMDYNHYLDDPHEYTWLNIEYETPSFQDAVKYTKNKH